MDKEKEIEKFKALLVFAAQGNEDLHREMHFQQDVLRSLGLDDGDINNLIHDRHAREGISIARAALAVTALRQAAGIPLYGSRPRYPREKTREEMAAAYLRARGRDASPPVSPPPPQPQPSGNSESRATGGTLLVPYGIDENAEIVQARDATAGNDYSCPGCAGPLVLRAGSIKMRHFAHKVDTACDGESLQHITAKLLVAKAIREHATADQRIALRCTCSECRKPFATELPRNAFSASIVEAPVGEFICDVVAVKGDHQVLAVEILQHHAVDEDKGRKLELPWIELKADEVLENPLHWRPVQARLKPSLCPECKAKRARLEDVKARWNLTQAPSEYVAAVAKCWSCHDEIIWYWWTGVPFAEKKPPAPVPRIVQNRHSKMYGGRYWMNVCPGCNAPQGDNFVFLSSDSPFKGLPLCETESMAERRKQESAGAVQQFMRAVKRNI